MDGGLADRRCLLWVNSRFPLRAFSGAVYFSMKEENISSNLLNATRQMRNLFIIPIN